jgi:hypothetical protein
MIAPLCPPLQRPSAVLVPPFGWRYEAGTWVPVPAEQGVLRSILELHRAGVAPKELAAKLNAAGARTRAGRYWSRNGVNWLLSKMTGVAREPGEHAGRKSRTAPPRRLTADERAELRAATWERPQTRGDCRGAGFCVAFSCRYNLALEVNPRTGSVMVRFPDPEDAGAVDVDAMPHSCALDLADTKGGMTLEAVADALGVTRERTRQIEEDAMRKLRRLGPRVLEALHAHLTPTHGPGEGER